MPTRDNFSNQIVTEAMPFTDILVGESVTKGNIIDTADYDMGIRFVIKAFFVDGTYTLSFEEGDDPALADAVVVGSDKIIGDAVILTAEPVRIDPWPGNGLFGTKRYVRAVISAFDVGNAEALFRITALLSGEYNRQDQ